MGHNAVLLLCRIASFHRILRPRFKQTYLIFTTTPHLHRFTQTIYFLEKYYIFSIINYTFALPVKNKAILYVFISWAMLKRVLIHSYRFITTIITNQKRTVCKNHSDTEPTSRILLQYPCPEAETRELVEAINLLHKIMSKS